MTTAPTTSLVLVLAVIICSYFPSAHSEIETFEVSIQDELFTESPILIIVCKAGHERKHIGSDSLRTGEIFKFTYKVNNTARAVDNVFCNIKVGGKQGLYGIFDYSRDLYSCGDDHKCRWTVAPPGLYQFYNGYFHLVYPW